MDVQDRVFVLKFLSVSVGFVTVLAVDSGYLLFRVDQALVVEVMLKILNSITDRHLLVHKEQNTITHYIIYIFHDPIYASCN